MKDPMLNTLLISYFLLSLVFLVSGSSLKDSRLDEKIIKYVKNSDRQMFLTIINQLENEMVKLVSNREDHIVNCGKILGDCRMKFSSKTCDLLNPFNLKQLKFNKINAEKELLESKRFYQQVVKAVKQNQKDCQGEKTLYQNSVIKLDSDINIVEELVKTIKARKDAVKKQLDEEKKMEEMKRKAAAKKKKKDDDEDDDDDKKKKRNSKKTIEIQLKSIGEKINHGKSIVTTEKQLAKDNIQKSPSTEVLLDLKKESASLIQTFSSQEKQGKNELSFLTRLSNGLKLLSNLNVKQFKYDVGSSLSLLQLSKEGLKKIELKTPQFANSAAILSQITSQLGTFDSLEHEFNFLKLSHEKIEVVSASLLTARENLHKTYKNSEHSCKERLAEFQKKSVVMQDSFIEAKIELESLKKKYILEESRTNLCTMSKNNLKTCDEIGSFCKAYEAEYESEIEDLKALIKYLNKSAEKTQD